MPSKVWVVGEEVLAADFNPYVQEQVVATFPNAAARDAALTAPKPGQHVYMVDTGLLMSWSAVAGAWCFNPGTLLAFAESGANGPAVANGATATLLTIAFTMPATPL